MKRLALVAGIAVAVTGSIAAVYQGGHGPNGEDANAAAKAARTKPHVMFDPAEYAGDGQSSAESFGLAFHLSFDFWRAMFFPAVKPLEPVQHLPSSASPSAPWDVTQPQSSSAAAVNSSAWVVGGQRFSSSGLLDGAFRMAGIDTALRTSMALFEQDPVPYVAATRVPGALNSDPNITTQSTNPSQVPNGILSFDRSAQAEAMALAWARYFQIAPSGALFASFAIESRTYSPGAGYGTLTDPSRSFPNPNGRTLGAVTESFPELGSQEPLTGGTLPGNGPPTQTPNVNVDDEPSAAVPEPRSILLVAAALYFLILMRLPSTPRR